MECFDDSESSREPCTASHGVDAVAADRKGVEDSSPCQDLQKGHQLSKLNRLMLDLLRNDDAVLPPSCISLVVNE